MSFELDVTHFRESLRIAKQMAIARIPFVVVPVTSKEDYDALVIESAKRLNQIAEVQNER